MYMVRGVSSSTFNHCVAKTHVLITEDHVDLLVVGSDPRDPIKVLQETGQVVGEPRPNESTKCRDGEELLSRHGSVLAFTKTLIFDRVKGVEQGSVDEGRRPDHGGWPDQHLSVETACLRKYPLARKPRDNASLVLTQTETDHLSTDDQHDLVTIAPSVFSPLVVEEPLDGNDVGGVSTLVTDTSHDSDQHCNRNKVMSDQLIPNNSMRPT
jgi:hypothetical protein